MKTENSKAPDNKQDDTNNDNKKTNDTYRCVVKRGIIIWMQIVVELSKIKGLKRKIRIIKSLEEE